MGGAGRWRWSDNPLPRGQGARWVAFARSAECLTTAFLASYALVFVLPGSTFATSPAFAWLAHLSRGREGPWAALAVALSLTGPVAVAYDGGFLRILSLLSQGAFFLLFGVSFRLTSPLGLGWITFALSGLWLLWRAATLLRHHRRRGG